MTHQTESNIEADTQETLTTTLLSQLSTDYSGRRAWSLLCQWSAPDAVQTPWMGDIESTWAAVLESCAEKNGQLELIKHALYDHPSDAVYMAALPPEEKESSMCAQLSNILACCAGCPQEDRPYRFGQWLPLIESSCEHAESDSDTDTDTETEAQTETKKHISAAAVDEAFLAGVAAFHAHWNTAERRAVVQQLQVLARSDDMGSSVEEAVDATTSFLHALADLAHCPPTTVAPWQTDVERLHRYLAHLVTRQIRRDKNPEHEIYTEEMQQAAQALYDHAPALIERIDKDLHTAGVLAVAPFLHAALQRIERAVQHQADKVSIATMVGLQQALWATKPSDYHASWTYQSPVTEQLHLAADNGSEG